MSFVSSATGARAASPNPLIQVNMTSSVNPSVVGQVVVFRIELESWCAAGGHYFEVYAVTGTFPTYQMQVLGYAPIPYAPAHAAYLQTSALAVGVHRVNARTPYCYIEQGVTHELVTNELTQTVKPKAASVAPPARAASPRPRASPLPSTSPPSSPAPTPSPSPAGAAQVQPVSVVTPTSRPVPPILLVAGLVVAAGAVVLGAIRLRRSRRRK